MCICGIHMCEYVRSSMLACKRAKRAERWTSGCLLWSFLYLVFWDEVSHWTLGSLFQTDRRTGWPRTAGILLAPPSSPKQRHYRCTRPRFSFYESARDPKCSKHFNHWAILLDSVIICLNCLLDTICNHRGKYFLMRDCVNYRLACEQVYGRVILIVLTEMGRHANCG